MLLLLDKKMKGFLTLSNSKEILHIPSDNIIYVAADGNYSKIVVANGNKCLVTMQLGDIEDKMNEQLGTDGRHLVRIGKSLIINMRYLFFINPAEKKLVLSDGKSVYISLSASKEALQKLKTYLEDNIDTPQP